jgi:dienelactone hydrolase
VVYPQRRGRGRSGGVYDEGFEPDRSRYSQDPAIASAGLDRAIGDVDQAWTWLRERPDVRHERVLVAGASRGGALAIAYAGCRPDHVCGALNFNGGWLGRRTTTYPEVNRAAFLRGAAYPGRTLWIYGSHDQYYPIAHCRSNFDAFVQHGGRGTFHALRGGHGLVEQPVVWRKCVEEYLASL